MIDLLEMTGLEPLTDFLDSFGGENNKILLFLFTFDLI